MRALVSPGDLIVRVAPSLLALLLALAISAVVIALAGANPALALRALAEGAFGSAEGWSEVGVRACPLLLAGLAVAIAFRAGLWNIGAEGQLVAGAMTVAWVGTHVGALPTWLAIALALGCAALAGAAWAAIAGLLKATRNVDEVISTIMLNFIALGVVGYLVHGPLMEAAGSYPQTDPVAAAARLPRLLGGYRVHAGLLIGLAAAAFAHLLLFHTVLGYEMRAAGLNPIAAHLAGVRMRRALLGGLAISGAFAGLAGGIEVSAVTLRLYDQFSPGYGYTAIAVALLGRLHPLGVIVAAVFFAALDVGSSAMQRSADVSSVLVAVMQATVIFGLIGFEQFGWRRTGSAPAPAGKTPASSGSHLSGSLPPVDMDAALLTALAASMVTMAVPLLLAALGELIAERAGVINIGLEGLILAGAFTALVTALFSGSPGLGLATALAVGALAGAGFAFFVVRRNANQVVAGTALNLLSLGLTGVAYRALFGVTGAALTIPGIDALPVPLLSRLPIVGPSFFSQTALAYAGFALVPCIAFVLARTVGGLKLRMVGENPYAAETQGVSVARVRSVALVACGALAAAGGAYLTLAYAKTFVEGMSAGRGFIALAIVIVGRRSAVGVLAAALFFGFATALQFHFQALGLAVPFQLFLILPYVMTLAVLAGLVGRAGVPGALGQPYER